MLQIRRNTHALAARIIKLRPTNGLPEWNLPYAWPIHPKASRHAVARLRMGFRRRSTVGTLFSGVGLASGLDIQSLVDRLIALESRPRDLLRNRVSNLDAQRTAYMDISARITAMLSRVTALGSRGGFASISAASSNSSALSATASEFAAPGSYSFLVKSLATTQQLVSRGFTSSSSAVGSGKITIESARARVNAQTRLDELNGYRGVQRG